MKLLDMVRVVGDKKEYRELGVSELVGQIIFAEIIDNTFYVNFFSGLYAKINVEDLVLEEDGESTDEEILADLPGNNPKLWCKVEDGYILNLLGEKKNKIPYEYNS